MAGGRKEEPGQQKKERTQNRKSKRQKRGRGMDEMGMGMLEWISSQFDNFVGAGLELELTVCTVHSIPTPSRYHLMLRTCKARSDQTW
jgi:hypothetical protein